jgi:hypothetical protein
VARTQRGPTEGIVKNVHASALLLFIAVAPLALPVYAADTAHEKHPGFIDGSAFLALASDDCTTVEVNLHGALLRAILGIDPELKEAVGGLESIHAVILSCEENGRAAKALDLIRQTERKLVDRDWEVLTRIKDGESNVTVLVLNDEESIQGLAVLVADAGGHEIVFANIAGTVDLPAIAKLGESLEIPGLDQVDK